jgi:hypothetical protein
MMRCRPGIVTNSELVRSRLSGAPLRKSFALHRIRDMLQSATMGDVDGRDNPRIKSGDGHEVLCYTPELHARRFSATPAL